LKKKVRLGLAETKFKKYFENFKAKVKAFRAMKKNQDDQVE